LLKPNFVFLGQKMLTQLAVMTSSATNAIFFKPVNKMLRLLRTLKQAVVEAQSTVIKALKADLNKPI